jgi:Alpha/beta hydrolase domain
MSPGSRRRALAVAVVVAFTAAAPAAAAPPTVQGPIPESAEPGHPSRDYIFYATPMDLRKVGYVEREYFVSGTATRYDPDPDDPLATQRATLGTMPFTTRIVVRRPANPRRFRGVVVVDWQNVTAGQDIDTEWSGGGDYFVRKGWAWVGASVQRVGVHGFAPPHPLAGGGLRQWNPSRYGPLDLTNGGTVTDDSQAFDVFTQIARLAKGRGAGVDPFPGMKVRRVYAAGVSQSARFLVLYYNTVHPLARAYDGFLPGLGGGQVRTDLPTKLLRVNTENDVWRGQADPALRTDTRFTRTWELTGGAHVPAAAVSETPGDFRAILGWIRLRDIGPQAPLECERPGPSDVEVWAAFHSAYAALDGWVEHDLPPPWPPPIETASEPVTTPAGTRWPIVRDGDGFALGGIRLPSVEVPVALNDGENAPANQANPLNAFCVLYGAHIPYDQQELEARYPSHRRYVARYAAAARRAVRQGVLLARDARALIREAARSDVGAFVAVHR